MLNRDIISDRSVVRSIKRSHGKSRCLTEILPNGDTLSNDKSTRPGLGGIVDVKETRCEIFVVKGYG